VEAARAQLPGAGIAYEAPARPDVVAQGGSVGSRYRQVQVGQPEGSFCVPFGHCGAHPSPGQVIPIEMGGGGSLIVGGLQPVDEPEQSQSQGGHWVFGGQLGQAQAQPPPPIAGFAWHVPVQVAPPGGQGGSIHWQPGSESHAVWAAY
jgi:hypothetical protein